jgi:hypothetical protein
MPVTVRRKVSRCALIPEPNGIQSVLDSLPHPNARNIKPASVMDTSILEEIKKSGFVDKLYGRRA